MKELGWDGWFRYKICQYYNDRRLSDFCEAGVFVPRECHEDLAGLAHWLEVSKVVCLFVCFWLQICLLWLSMSSGGGLSGITLWCYPGTLVRKSMNWVYLQAQKLKVY